MALEDALAKIPGLAGYLGQEQFTQRQNLGQLQQLSQAQTLQKHFQEQQREQGLRRALSELGPNATDEERLAAITPYVGADKAFSAIEARKARQATLDQNSLLKGQQMDQRMRMFREEMDRLKIPEAARRQAEMEYKQRIAGANAEYSLPGDVLQKYGIGTPPAAAPQQAPAQPQPTFPPAQPVQPPARRNGDPAPIRFTPEEEAGNSADLASPESRAALDRELARKDLPPQARAILEAERARIAQGAPDPVEATQPPTTPVAMNVGAPDAANLDPRDLKYRGGEVPPPPVAAAPAQGAPVARGEPQPAPGAPVARGLPTPPPELEAQWAKLPRGGPRGSDAERTKWIAKAVGGGTPASDDAVANDAWYTIINGKARPGSLPIGRDEGNRYRAQLREKTAEIAKELGLSPQELASLGMENRSKAMALNAVQKDLAAIRPYKEMLDLNANIAIDLAKKISNSRTGSQFVNKPITWLQANASDNPDIAEYLFQIRTVAVEGARVLNNPRLVGQLTDSARHEMAEVINGNMPLGQTTRVLQRMVSDGANRVNSIVKEKDSLVSSIRGSANKDAPKASDSVKGAVEKAGYAYEPDTYEYRVGIGGQVQRRKK